MTLHTETDIYRAVTELAMFITRAVADLRRDLKPTYGRFLIEESVLMAVNVREANIARDAAKLPILDEILRQVEAIQFSLRVLRQLGFFPNRGYEQSLPLTVSVARQATALRNHFAPAPSPVA